MVVNTTIHLDTTDDVNRETFIRRMGTILRAMSAALPGIEWHVTIAGNHPQRQEVQDLCYALGYE
jgi:hypothetical protein